MRVLVHARGKVGPGLVGGGDFYTAQDIRPAGTAPALTAGESVVDPIFGHRVFCLLTSGQVAYSYWPSFNSDTSRILVSPGDVYDVAWTATTVSLTNQRSAFGVTLGWWEGTIWHRTNPALMYFAYGSTAQPRIYQRNMDTDPDATLLKDFFLDGVFTAQYGSSGRYLWQLRVDQAMNVFTATVRNTAGDELGGVVWIKSTDTTHVFPLPGGEGWDEIGVSRDGLYAMALYFPSRQWQVMRISDGVLSAVQMSESPAHSDGGDSKQWRAGGGIVSYDLAAAMSGQVSGSTVFAFPLKNGKDNPFDDGHTSLLADDGFVYGSNYVGLAGTSTAWVLHSGSIYKVNWQTEMDAWTGRKFAPEDVIYDGTRLTQMASIDALVAGSWYYDEGATTVYCWTPAGADLTVAGNNANLRVYDWRAFFNEVYRVSEDGLTTHRLCHHHSALRGGGNEYNTLPKGNVAYDGAYFVFNAHRGGQTGVYAVRTTPESIPLLDVAIPAQVDWTDRGQVLAKGTAGQWDLRLDTGYSPCTVVKLNGTYYLYYIGADGNRASDGGPNNRRIGVATSGDGIAFTKHPSNPIIEWSPNACPANDDEEGAFSATAWVHEGTIYLFIGAMTDVGCTGSVSADPELYTSTDGITFTPQGTAVDVATDEAYPIGVWRDDNGTWWLYYVDAIGGDGVLRYASGNDPLALVDGGQILAGERSGGGDVFKKSETEIIVPVGTSLVTDDLDIFTPLQSAPTALGVSDVIYDFTNYQRGTLFLDRQAGKWFLYHAVTDFSEVRVKTAPIVYV